VEGRGLGGWWTVNGRGQKRTGRMVDRVWKIADCGLQAVGPWRVVDRGLCRNRLRRRMKDGELWIAGCRTVDLEPRVVGLGWVRKISTNDGG